MVKKIWNVLTTILTIIVVLLACIFFVPKLFGITPMAVLSGSMEPTYSVGGLVFIQDVSPESIEVGDPITYQLPGANTVVTHRVIQIDTENRTVETKGDANDTKDGSPVPFDNIQGKALSFSIPYIGYLAVYMSSTQGVIILGTLLAMILLLSFLPDFLSHEEKDKKKGDEAE